MEMYREVNARRIIFAGLVSVLALAVVTISVHAWYKFEERREMDAKGANSQPMELVELQSQQRANLEKVAWANKEKTAVTIPLAQAREYVIQHQGKLPASRPVR